MRLIQLAALGVSGAFGFAAGARAGALAGALAAGALAGAFAGALAAGALAAGALAAGVLGAAVRAAVVGLGVGVEAELRTGAGTGFFFAGALAAGVARIGFFIGALADIVKFVCIVCWRLKDDVMCFERKRVCYNVVREKMLMRRMPYFMSLVLNTASMRLRQSGKLRDPASEPRLARLLARVEDLERLEASNFTDGLL